MFKHLLVPTEGPELSEGAIRLAVEFAKHIGARISFLTVTEPFHTISLKVDQVDDTPGEYQRHVAERAARALSKGAARAQEAGVSYETIHLKDDHPYQAIIRTAEEGLRPRRGGVAWPARALSRHSGEPDRERPDAFDDSGAGVSAAVGSRSRAALGQRNGRSP